MYTYQDSLCAFDCNEPLIGKSGKGVLLAGLQDDRLRGLHIFKIVSVVQQGRHKARKCGPASLVNARSAEAASEYPARREGAIANSGVAS